ncbi:MAG: hypothetical protein HQ574_04830 [Chloroflexi bacterium]|nr:hypothetical protein [Chloroflexota bacterium]
MKTIFTAILKFIAFILAGILIFALPLSLLANNAGEVLFDEEEINGIATTVVLDSEIIPAALEIITNRQAEDISTKIEDADPPGGRELNLFNLIYSMEEHNWNNFRQALLVDEVVARWITDTTNGFFHWLDSEDQIPNIIWDLAPMVEKMRGPEGEEAVVAFYDSLPDCTDLQMEEMKTEPGDPLPRTKMVKELCKLSTYPHVEQIQVYNDIMKMVVNATPPEYNATQSALKNQAEFNGMFTLKWNLRTIRWNLDTVLLIPLVLLFLILIFGVRSLDGLGQWWGIPLIGGGLISLVTALLYRPLWTGLLTDRMPEAIPQTSLLYHELIEGSTRIISPIFNPLTWQSFLVLLLGVGFLAMGFILRVRRAGGEKSS